MKSILVTGGAGFIGSHTCVALIEAGYRVTIIDNLANSHIEVLDGIEKITGKRPDFYNVDMSDAAALDTFFETHGSFDGVIHFAAYKAVGESVAEPLKYYANNLGSLLNLLEQMRRLNMANLVFSSSCTVYGQPDKLPVTEASPIREAESPYGNTKIVCEEILGDVVKAGVVNAIALRYFNPAGAHPSALIGELPLGVPNNLVPVVTQTAIGKREKIVVFGDDYDTKDGSCIRDFIHVMDLARAHVVAVDRMISGKQKSAFEVFNIGTGTGYTVLEVLKTFEKVSGVKLNYEIGPRRAGDIEKIYADTTLANNELGWSAIETLESMMSSAWAWEKQLSMIS